MSGRHVGLLLDLNPAKLPGVEESERADELRATFGRWSRSRCGRFGGRTRSSRPGPDGEVDQDPTLVIYRPERASSQGPRRPTVRPTWSASAAVSRAGSSRTSWPFNRNNIVLAALLEPTIDPRRAVGCGVVVRHNG